MLGIRLRLKIDHNLVGVEVWRDFTTMSNNKMWSRTVYSWVYIPTRWFYRHCYLAKLILYHYVNYGRRGVAFAKRGTTLVTLVFEWKFSDFNKNSSSLRCYLILINVTFYDFVSPFNSLLRFHLVSIEKLYQTVKTFFGQFSKHLKVHQKYSSTRRIFNSSPNNEEAFWSRNTQKKNFLSLQQDYGSRTHDLPDTGYLEGHGFDSRWGLRKFFFWVFRLENASSLFTFYPSHQSIYRLFPMLGNVVKYDLSCLICCITKIYFHRFFGEQMITCWLW